MDREFADRAESDMDREFADRAESEVHREFADRAESEVDREFADSKICCPRTCFPPSVLLPYFSIQLTSYAAPSSANTVKVLCVSICEFEEKREKKKKNLKQS